MKPERVIQDNVQPAVYYYTKAIARIEAGYKDYSLYGKGNWRVKPKREWWPAGKNPGRYIALAMKGMPGNVLAGQPKIYTRSVKYFKESDRPKMLELYRLALRLAKMDML